MLKEGLLLIGVIKKARSYNAKQEQKEIGEKLQWMSEFITVSDEMKDNEAKDFYNTLQRDIFEANVYALTPAGRIVEVYTDRLCLSCSYRGWASCGRCNCEWCYGSF